MVMQRVILGIGAGAVAGLVGTFAITLSQELDMRIRRREPSRMPVKAVEKVFHAVPEDEEGEQRVAQGAHWGYGIAWGVVRGLMAAMGIRGLTADLIHFAGVEGAAMGVLPKMGIAPPAKDWGGKEIAIESAHHVFYAGLTGWACDLLLQGGRGKR